VTSSQSQNLINQKFVNKRKHIKKKTVAKLLSQSFFFEILGICDQDLCDRLILTTKSRDKSVNKH